MPTLNINGKRVKVDDSFLSLSPEEQDATVDEIAASIGAPAEAAPVAEETAGLSPDNPLVQANAGFNEGLVSVLGAPVDLVNKGLGLISGGALESERPFLGSEMIGDTLGAVIGEAPAPSEEGINPALRRIGQEVGATVVPGGAVLKAGAMGAKSTLPVVGDILKGARATPGTFAATEAGSALASGTGAAVANEVAPDNPLAEFTGQVIGAGLPGAIAGATRAMVPGRANIADTVKTFESAGSTPSLGQATGSRLIQALETGTGSLPGGAGVMAKFSGRQQQEIGKRVNLLAARLAENSSPAKAGKAIKKGLVGSDGFMERFRRDSARLFDQIGLDGQPVATNNTAQVLANMTAAVPGAEQIGEALLSPGVRRIADAFLADAVESGGTMPYDALKRLRTRLGEMAFSPDMLTDTNRGALKTIYKALTSDMEAAAKAAGPDTARAFQRANSFYKEKADIIDDYLDSVSKKAAPEDVFKWAMQGRDGASRIGAVRNSLKPPEWRIAVSAFMKRLGHAKSSSQDDLGDVFSTETFLTNWNNLDTSAKDALFRGVDEFKSLRKDLDTVAAATSRIREGSTVLQNPSGTAPRILNVGGSLASMGGGVALASGGAFPVLSAALLAGPGLNNAVARMLTHPKVVNWFARSTKMNELHIPSLLVRLEQIAKEEPEMKEPIRQYVETLKSGFVDAPPSEEPRE
jgi:hypothetical protein